MKKNGKPKGRGDNGSELEEMGLDESPAFKRAKVPSAIELARLAAALEKDSTSEVSAGHLAARARRRTHRSSRRWPGLWWRGYAFLIRTTGHAIVTRSSG